MGGEKRGEFMRYLKILLSICAVFSVAGCVTGKPDTSGLVGDVRRFGGGQYYVDGIGSFTSPQVQALMQCRVDGNKQLQVVSNSFATGFSGTVYPALIFRCN